MRFGLGMVFVASMACGPATTPSPEGDSSGGGATSSESASEASGASSSGGDTASTGSIESECLALDELACEAEPACEPLLAYPEQRFTCYGPEVFVGCQPAGCPGSPCWICEGEFSVDRSWAPTCGCLSEPWVACEGAPDAPTEIDMCDCNVNDDCSEDWQLCENGMCRGCDDWIQSCDCFSLGCAPGRCCGWESYCLPGEPEPDGTCPMR